MSNPHIEITFDENGAPSIEGVGFKGKGCQEATEPFEKALGQVDDRKLKPEYHQQATASVSRRLNIGGRS